MRFTKSNLPASKGKFLAITQVEVTATLEDLIAYSMTKAAMITIARGLAHTTKGTQVTVNTVMPGSTLSEGAERFLAEQALRENKTKDEVAADFFTNVRTSSLLGRFATTDEVAHAVVYLASPLASATNGSVMKVEGGSTF